jgi:hypothetical protein
MYPLQSNVQWSPIIPDAINLDVSPFWWYFLETTYKNLSYLIQLSGCFIYLKYFPGNQSVLIYEAPLYIEHSIPDDLML